MKYRTPEAFRDALEQRLRNESRETDIGLIRLRKHAAFERFLARLTTVAPERWVLKGAFALELRFGLRTRMTKDIDLESHDSDEATVSDLRAATRIDLGDFFSFDVRRNPALDVPEDFAATRYTVTSELAGRRFEQFPLDIAPRESPGLTPDRLRGPGALSFAGIEPPTLPVIPVEQHIAEKLHAYTGTYGTQGRGSTRVKDLIDLVLIADFGKPNASALRDVLEQTFRARKRQPLPQSLPAPPTDWAPSYARQAREVGQATSLSHAHAKAATLLNPILAREQTGHWDPTAQKWVGE